jgi:cellulose synthase/poly-beta-1,6-N-acetylglucosamine synthase-like glycosyltransferase
MSRTGLRRVLSPTSSGTVAVRAGLVTQALRERSAKNGHAGQPAVPETVGERGRPFRPLITAVFVLGALGCIAATVPGPWVLVGTVVMGLSLASRGDLNRDDLMTAMFGVTVATTSVDYLAWRAAVTNWAGWEIAVPLLAAEVFGAMHTLGLQYTVWPSTRQRPRLVENPSRRPIFVLIPTVNEGVGVLTPTIRGALQARRRYLKAFPDGRVTIVVCNDARVAGVENWHEVEELAQGLGVTCITRSVGGGNKAGNLEHVRQTVDATGESLVAIFDADQIARPNFLLKTVPHFADPKVGWVQTGQYYANLDQPVARWANDQQALFYRVLCPGKSAQNAAFICGTNVVIRAAALDQIGGLPQDSVTEDFAASIQLHPRWRSVYLTDVLAVGLGPMDLPAFLRQQRRWAIGTIGVLRTHWRAILLPGKGGLSIEQRIQYALACTHYLCGLRDLVYVVSPLLFIVTGIPAVRTATLGLFLWHFLPYLVASQAAFWYASRGQTGLRGVIMGFGSFPVLILALVAVVLGHRGGFMVTSKRRRKARSWRHLTVYAVALACCGAGILLALSDRRLRPESVTISVLWVVYDMALLGSFLWLGIMDLRFKDVAVNRPWRPVQLAAGGYSWLRRRASIPALAGVTLNAGTPRGALLVRFSRSIQAIRQPSAAVAMVLLSSTFLLQVCSTTSPDHVVLVANREPGQSPYLGLSLPHQALDTRPGALRTLVCLPFAVIGRTQDIGDSFDVAWANRLSAQDQHPWISLQFGNFGADGKPPLDASLPAIMNGVQDRNIERWARDIRAYGRTVYVTILLHVDRNWSVSSAVANGGIPQDVSRAWEHVRSIFSATGDTNVAWVWSPADPANDQAYAPPEPAIDIVLQSMIRYPGTPWPDPEAVLSAVGERHPAKALFVEVSAVGAPAEKAAWLEQVATAVAADPRVYALMYHDGAPDVHATGGQDAQWSVESDAGTLRAMATWRSLVPTATLPCQSPSLSGGVG